jgi:carbon storage regulator
MLIIRRKAGESILLDEQIEIQVIEISSSRVKLGISAPASVLILRKEMQQAERQNRAAAESVCPATIAELVARLRHQDKQE